MGGSRTRLYRVRKIESIVIERLHFIGDNATASLLESTVDSNIGGLQPFRSSLAKFTATRRASSRVRSLLTASSPLPPKGAYYPNSR